MIGKKIIKTLCLQNCCLNHHLNHHFALPRGAIESPPWWSYNDLATCGVQGSQCSLGSGMPMLGTAVLSMISLQLFTIYQCMSTKKGKGFPLFKWWKNKGYTWIVLSVKIHPPTLQKGDISFSCEMVKVFTTPLHLLYITWIYPIFADAAVVKYFPRLF